MEGKAVIMTVLLLSLVLGQSQELCCPTYAAQVIYLACLSKLGIQSQELCLPISGCKLLTGTERCPPWNHDILENTGDNAVNEYCKLGCLSSVCGAITTLQISDASEVVNGAIEKCTKACSALCTKGGSITAVETT